MEISQTKNGTSLTISVSGRLDTVTAPQLEKVISSSLDGVVDLKLDFADLEYVSSAGLRVILIAQKIMSGRGKMAICNANDSVKEIFDITGFVDILSLE